MAQGRGDVPPMRLGELKPLHLRVQIDEADIVRFSPEAPAIPAPRGDSEREFRLRFSHIEPLLLPKRTLTAATTEFVDTQVLHVIYTVDQPGEMLCPGMRMDVLIEAPRPPRAPPLPRAARPPS